MNSFYLWLDDQQQGPFTLEQLRSRWEEGSVNGNTLYCLEGMKDWLPLSNIEAEIKGQPPKRSLWALITAPAEAKVEFQPSVHDVPLAADERILYQRSAVAVTDRRLFIGTRTWSIAHIVSVRPERVEEPRGPSWSATVGGVILILLGLMAFPLGWSGIIWGVGFTAGGLYLLVWPRLKPARIEYRVVWQTSAGNAEEYYTSHEGPHIQRILDALQQALAAHTKSPQ